MICHTVAAVVELITMCIAIAAEKYIKSGIQ